MPTHPPKKSLEPRRPDPQDVARLHAAGVSRNGTARALSVSTRQVDRTARELGLSWSRGATEDATAARRAAAEEERLELAAVLRRLALDSAARALLEPEAAARRSYTLTAEAAARSDLALWEATSTEGRAHAVLGRLQESFSLLDAAPLEGLTAGVPGLEPGLEQEPERPP